MTLRKTLAAYFLPTRRLIGIEDGPLQHGGRLGGAQWVVPRAHCQYRRLDMAAIPVRQRAAAARLALAAQLPAPGALCTVAWKDGIGHAWIWIDPPVDFAAGRRRWIAESLLAPPPLGDGARMLQLAVGVEGQVWKGGQLLASQWWPQPPDDEGWGRFLRSAGLDRATPLPAAEQFAWRAEPWGTQTHDWMAGSVEARERLAWVGAAALVALIAGWQLTALARWHFASEGLAQQLELARAEVAPVLAARERAEHAQAEAQRLRELQHGTSDYEMMSQVVAALPEGVQLASWRREPGRLVAVVNGGDGDPRTFVSAFVRQPPLNEVAAVPAGTGMQLTFDLADAGAQGVP
ncbi:hypothetical protein [Luteimonas sp. 3794]|uniref:hypothetical protein n=1 Tax=Luteimonas sp. 3794 TaxID=2817730 RepID=UPI00285DAEF0|nr:hypothetical protein [Luteimonas sp. 3794]MDR6991854.1 hypothetical protein [Luteimonas sp. 3794]